MGDIYQKENAVVVVLPAPTQHIARLTRRGQMYLLSDHPPRLPPTRFVETRLLRGTWAGSRGGRSFFFVFFCCGNLSSRWFFSFACTAQDSRKSYTFLYARAPDNVCIRTSSTLPHKTVGAHRIKRDTGPTVCVDQPHHQQQLFFVHSFVNRAR